MERGTKRQKEMGDPQRQTCEPFQLFASAMTMSKQVVDQRNQFVVLVWVQRNDSVEEIKAPSNPINHWT